MEEFQKSKKKNQEEPKREDVVFDPYSSLPSDILIDVLKHFLKLPQQIFQGYLLKNVPRNLQEAHELFQMMQSEGIKDDIDAVLHILPDFQTMEEQLKKHQKQIGKETEHTLTPETIDYYEKFMNYYNRHEELIQYYR